MLRVKTNRIFFAYPNLFLQIAFAVLLALKQAEKTPRQLGKNDARYHNGHAKTLLVMLNFKNKTATANTGIDLSHATLLLGNYPKPSNGATLQPYEAVVYQL